MDALRRDLGSWLGGVLGGPDMGGPLAGWQTPPVDVVDLGDRYEVAADLPGIRKEGIEVNASDNRLELRAEAETKQEDAGRTYRNREIGRRAYYRSLLLPSDADPERAKARLDAGCLVVTVPKKAGVEKRGRRVPVE